LGRHLVALLLLIPPALALVLGCTATAPPPGATPGTAGEAAQREEGGLRLSLKLDKPSYRVGEPVDLTFTVANVSQATFQHNLRTSQAYDFLVTREGKEVWRWSGDKGFLQVITEFTLAPGQARDYRQSWSQVDNQGNSVGPGEYKFVGVLKTLPERRSPTVTAQVR
jgi:hypothetical protein